MVPVFPVICVPLIHLQKLGFEPVVEEAGDCYARTMVRIRELYQSMDLVIAACNNMPEGDIAVPVKAKPKGNLWRDWNSPVGKPFTI